MPLGCCPRDAARQRLQHLAEAHPAAKRAIYDASVVQPPETRPAEWTVWWKHLKSELKLEASRTAAVRTYWDPQPAGAGAAQSCSCQP